MVTSRKSLWRASWVPHGPVVSSSDLGPLGVHSGGPRHLSLHSPPRLHCCLGRRARCRRVLAVQSVCPAALPVHASSKLGGTEGHTRGPHASPLSRSCKRAPVASSQYLLPLEKRTRQEAHLRDPQGPPGGLLQESLSCSGTPPFSAHLRGLAGVLQARAAGVLSRGKGEKGFEPCCPPLVLLGPEAA